MLLKEGAVLMAGAREGAVIHLYVLSQRIGRNGGSRFSLHSRRRRPQFEPTPALCRFDGRVTPSGFRGRSFAEQMDRQVKTRAFQQRKDAAAAVRHGNDDCRHIGKIGTVGPPRDGGWTGGIPALTRLAMQ